MRDNHLPHWTPVVLVITGRTGDHNSILCLYASIRIEGVYS